MKSWAWGFALAVLGVASAANGQNGSDAGPASSSSQQSAPPPAAAVGMPSWLRKPDSNDVARVYPLAARRARIGGYVKMSCKVTAEGLLTGCSIAAESPPDAGFGAAALGLASDFALTPTTSDGKSVAGSTIVIPLWFRPPG